MSELTISLAGHLELPISQIQALLDLPAKFSALGDKLDAINQFIQQEISKMATALETLQAEVARNTEVEKSALVLIHGFKAQLDAAIASGDPAALTALSDTLAANDSELAAAVAANTPANPTPNA